MPRLPRPSYLPHQASGRRATVGLSLLAIELAVSTLTCLTALLPWFQHYGSDFAPTDVHTTLVQEVLIGATASRAYRFNVEDALVLAVALCSVGACLFALRWRRWLGIQLVLVFLLGFLWFDIYRGANDIWIATPDIGMAVALIGILLTIGTNIALQFFVTPGARERPLLPLTE